MSRQVLPSCSCGSGKSAPAHFDARGIFLCYACSDCVDQQLGKFRPEVLTDPNYWVDEPIEEDE
jgi:hypothetical protein